ncbi:MAG: rhamnosyltransferase [Planctomycetota bacterium]|jgi:rhamnosyltransferase
MDGMTAQVTVFIPTLNGGSKLGEVLDAVLAQECDFEFDLLVFDSESTDEKTHQALKDRNVEWRTIRRTEFNHGQTRNEAAQASSSEVMAFLSQDACPANRRWLAKLVDPILRNNAVASYAAQQPTADCHPYQLLNLNKHMDEAEELELRQPLTAAEFEAMEPQERVERIRFDNVSSAIRRTVLLELPFPVTDFGEDLEWSRNILLAGESTAFVKNAVVFHSHAVSKGEFFDRVMAVHKSLRELCDFVPIDNRRLQLRRILGTTLRFQQACLATKTAGFATRFLGFVMAPVFATMQMEAMYRGCHQAEYQAPETGA